MSGEPAVTEREVERPQLNLQHTTAVRCERHAAVQHGLVGEPRVDEPDVGERRRVGAHHEVPEQRVPRPLHRAARAELCAGEPHTGEVDVERAPVDRHAADDVGDRQLRVAALRGEAHHVDANALLARRLNAERRQPRVEVLEAPHAVTAVLPRVLYLFYVGTRHLAVFLQTQGERAILDLHIAQQDERSRAGWAQRFDRHRVLFTETQQLVEVCSAVGVLHDVDDGPVQAHFQEDHAARREVDRVVPELRPGQPCDERRVGIEQTDIGEHHPGQQ